MRAIVCRIIINSEDKFINLEFGGTNCARLNLLSGWLGLTCLFGNVLEAVFFAVYNNAELRCACLFVSARGFVGGIAI